MKKCIWFVIFLLLVTFLTGQSNFSLSIDIDEGSDTGWSVEVVDDGILLLSGSRCFNSSLACVGLAKTDLEGNLLWKRNYNLSPNTMIAGGEGSLIVDGGNIFINGETYNPQTEQLELWLMKLDSNGDSLWRKDYILEGVIDSDVLIKASDGNYLFHFAVRDSNNDDQNWVFKVDSIGEIMWQQKYGNLENDIQFGNLIELSSKQFLIGFEMCGIPCYWGTRRPGIYLLDSLGNELWFKDYEDRVSTERTETFALPTSKGFILSWNKDLTLLGPVGDQYKYPTQIIGLDTIGNELWEHTFFTKAEKLLYNMRKTSNGDIIGLGQIVDTDVDGFVEGWIFRMTEDGELLWERRVHDPTSSFNNEPFNYFHDVEELDDGSLVCIGHFADTFPNGIPHPINHNIWLVKLDENGCYEPGCNDSLIITNTEKIFLSEKKTYFEVFPNPVNDMLKIRFVNELFRKGRKLILYDALGRKQEEMDLNFYTDLEEIDFRNYPKGIYFLILSDGVQSFQTEKIIKFE